MTTAEELFFYDFGLRTIKKFALEGFFHFRVAPRDRVTHDHAVGCRCQVFRAVTLLHRYAQRLEHRRHRRINVLVGSGYMMSAGLEHSGERGHRSPTNADQVIVHVSPGNLVEVLWGR